MKHRLLKQGLFALAFAVGSTAMAQTTNADDANLEKGTDEARYVKLVDNKGTIKYLRSNNGITTITSTSAGNRTTTTWQLGGALTDDTYIDLDGNKFGFQGVDSASEGTERSFLVLEGAEGNLKKVSLNDLVTGIYHPHTVGAYDDTGSVEILVQGIPAIMNSLDANAFKLSVYRNGIKLRIENDFTVAEGKVTITTSPLHGGDEFEIHYIN